MAVVMLWWKQQVNTGYWRKNIYCKWNTAMRAFVLVFVHNQTSQLLFVTVRWKHNHCDTRALRPRRDYKLASLATLRPLASRELLLSQKKYNFSIFQTWFSRYPSPLVLRYVETGGGSEESLLGVPGAGVPPGYPNPHPFSDQNFRQLPKSWTISNFRKIFFYNSNYV